VFIAVTASFALCSIGTTMAILLSRKTAALGFDEVAAQIGARPILLISLPLAMLLGIWTNAVWTQLSDSGDPVQDKVDIGAAIRRAAQSRRFWQSILVSPIVFAAVYSLTKSEPDAVVGLLLAFQNGFFWNSVLEGRTPKLAA
jgi:hypothetical protein